MSVFIGLSSRKEMKDILNHNGFIFAKTEFSLEEIADLRSNKNAKEIILSKLKKFDPEVKDIIVCVETVDEGKDCEMHTHLYPCEYIFLTWIPHGEYEGREFLYGQQDNIEKFKPVLGDVALMKVNDLQYVHGVGENIKGKIDTYISFVNPQNDLGQHLTVNNQGELI